MQFPNPWQPEPCKCLSRENASTELERLENPGLLGICSFFSALGNTKWVRSDEEGRRGGGEALPKWLR